jgi:hypothetical protein
MSEKYYTPKEYEATFHESWGEKDAVYFVDYTDTDEGKTDCRFWRVGTLCDLEFIDDLESGEVLCATTHCPANDYVHRKEGNDGKKADN